MIVSRETYNKNKKFFIKIAIFAIIILGFFLVSFRFDKYTHLRGIKDVLEEKIRDEVEIVDDFLSKNPLDFDNLIIFSNEARYRDFLLFNPISRTLKFTSNDIVIDDVLWDIILKENEVFHLTTKNKHYLARKLIDENDVLLIHLIAIKYNFLEENSYLNNTFLLDEQIPQEVKVNTLNDDGIEIICCNEKPGFKIVNDVPLQLSVEYSQIIFYYFLIFLGIFLYLLWLIYERTSFFKDKIWIRFFLYSFNVIALFFVLIYFKIPSILYKNVFFNDSSIILFGNTTSLGYLVLYVFVFFIISTSLWYYDFPVKSLSKFGKYVFTFIVSVFQYSILWILFYFIENIIYNTNIPIQLYSQFKINAYSILVVLSIALITLSFIFSILFSVRFFKEAVGVIYKIVLSVFVISLWVIFSLLVEDYIIIFLISIQVIIIFLYYSLIEFRYLYIILMLFLLNAFYLTYFIKEHYEKKQEDVIKVQSIGLLNNRDKILEIKFFEEIVKLEEEIKTNNYNVIRKLSQSAKRVDEFIIENYLYSFKDKYYINITHCDENTNLLINNQKNLYNCFDYFANIIQEMGVNTLSPDLYFIDDGDQIKSYIAIIQIPNGDILYIDIYEKLSIQAKGYPELLVGEKNSVLINPEHSYAFYRDDKLVKFYGNYNFPIVFDSTLIHDNQKYNFHYFSQNKIKIVIATNKTKFTDYFATVSYWFLILLISYILVDTLFYKRKKGPKFLRKFRSRLQFYILSILLIAFLLIATFSLLYLKNKTIQKNKHNLKELSKSILLELEDEYSDLQFISIEDAEDIYSKLMSLSNVFFTDINIYGNQGYLVASSRPEIFENQIINMVMNPIVFKDFKEKKHKFLITTENIGDYEFLSSYFPLINFDNKVIAYINIPYLSKEEQITQELTSYISTFINIYIIITILSIFVIWMIANYITNPMEKIKNAIRKTKISEKNIKIKVDRDDEIGDLINEYNKMIDELEDNVQKLSENERDMAWREMAKQVAHEIKNPLTPMKLYIQQLERMYMSDDEEKNKKLLKFSNTLIQQINSLSDIATAFSDFAQMPTSNLEPVDVKQIAEEVIELYNVFPNIKVELDGTGNFISLVDDKQMKRIFINLIENAIQAIEENIQGHIYLDFSNEDNKIRILISDNGGGVPEDKKDKIFLPNFTTKSSGSGLGLAIARNIIESYGGSIRVLSTSKKGTTFEIFLGLFQKN